MNCYLHENRPATKTLNVPCAPGGKIHICDECNTEGGRRAVFEKYAAAHGDRIRQKRATDPYWRGEDGTSAK